MVKRDTKYKTNRKLRKNKGFLVDKQLTINGVIASNTSEIDYAKPLEEQAFDFGKEHLHEYRLVTDSTTFEKVDKNERKKIFRKTIDKASQEEQKTLVSSSEDESIARSDSTIESQSFSGSIKRGYINSKIDVGRFITKNDQCLPPSENSEEAEKNRDREDAKRSKRVLRISINPNHTLNSIKRNEIVKVEERQFKKIVHDFPWTNKWLYNGDYKLYRKLNRKKTSKTGVNLMKKSQGKMWDDEWMQLVIKYNLKNKKI